jgi:DNA-binding Xre family transcriptional regulator
MEKKMRTKIELILSQRNLSQTDLQRLIQDKSGFKIGRDRISKIVTGKIKNYTLETAKMISEALNVKIDDIVELENIKKNNYV